MSRSEISPTSPEKIKAKESKITFFVNLFCHLFAIISSVMNLSDT